LLNQTIAYLEKLWETFGIDIPKLHNTHTHTHTLEPRKYKLTHINDGHKYTHKNTFYYGGIEPYLEDFLVATILIYTHNTTPPKIYILHTTYKH